ncbi:MAG: T9SS type A sorting domain-containing protein, partial [Flavobacterium sp.]|nr:T9SS type A sorting domain-containing protein [Flavobacterium sp.]
SVYPNPTTSFLNVSFNKEFSGSICDFTGKKLLSFSTKTVDLSQLASGIYVLDVISEDKRYTKKIIKQ